MIDAEKAYQDAIDEIKAKAVMDITFAMQLVEESPCYGYGEHLHPHPDAIRRNTCIRCGRPVDSPL